MQLIFGIQSSGAWSPIYQKIADWQQWPNKLIEGQDNQALVPKLPQVPAMQRRRYSKLTKMLLEVAFQCHAPANCRTIFASRHGELNRTVDLLQDIVREQPISPIGFSQSVHNTASGIFSILTNNRSPSTSIAAGETTLAQALIEAYGQLSEDNSDLLLVFGDEPVADIYKEFTDEPELPIALALQLTLPKHGQELKLTLSLETQPTAAQLATVEPICYGQLLHAIASQQNLCGQLNQFVWHITHG
ncbi:beta-ketoacyl synthase chain length factor [Shewanella psychrotolerans]|uniref:beta-ketoacyl synthase chain length factor n=1 Tax=Shewanella psychrotolerans TaxID=2864206 RepID=UPI001C658041|nr:beta-ketoacyl synthase chain length factor [Shewanella psychrotolerans]QYK01715.1 beta-ketoacyl synthase chain length factor [Shewanella psychrotolerans]